MTIYEYAGEMADLCFKISQAFKVLGDSGLYDFYRAACEGFCELQGSFTVEEAQQLIDNDQERQLESTAAYVKEVQKQAAEKMDLEVTA